MVLLNRWFIQFLSANRKVLAILIAFLGVILFFYFITPNEAARFLWNKAGLGPIALTFAKNDAHLLFEIGNHYFGGKAYNLVLAKIAYKKALAADPNRQFIHYQLARIYFVEGKYEEALREINRELTLYPENLRSLYIRGLIYGYKGDLEAAETDFSRFVAWAPREWAGYNDLAWVQMKARKYEKARGTIKNAFQIVPEAETNPWLWNSLGVAELNLGNRGAAFIAFETADKLASAMKEEAWAAAYPGNNPANRNEGFAAFRETIKKNLEQITAGTPIP